MITITIHTSSSASISSLSWGSRLLDLLLRKEFVEARGFSFLFRWGLGYFNYEA
jgi:hypothetical protein